MTPAGHPRAAWLAVVAAALGYFVDIYDLILFGIVRVASLEGLGYHGPTTALGARLLDLQLVGLLVGGILWGVWADRRGRLQVLFGSIALYSVANLLNAFVTDVWQYGALRLVAGIGLAGELGAGVTLVAESLRTTRRGVGTTLIAAFGLLGAVAASLIGGAQWGLHLAGTPVANWRVAYFIGGVMGLALLAFRIGVRESGIYTRTRTQAAVPRGQFLHLLRHGPARRRYLRSIALGLPIWYAVGILVFFSKELAPRLGVTGPVSVPRAVMLTYLGLSLGDIACGVLSQVLRSRRRALGVFIGLSFISTVTYFLARGVSVTQFYAVCLFLGFAAGYWAVFVTVAAEQFGTNLRATVTTTVPNFVRGSVVLMLELFLLLQQPLGPLGSAAVVGILPFALALWAVFTLEETFYREMDFTEEVTAG